MTTNETMDHHEYRAALETLALTQIAAADFLKIDHRTSRRWAGGEAPIPTAVAILLRVMVAKRLSVEAVYRIAFGEDFYEDAT